MFFKKYILLLIPFVFFVSAIDGIKKLFQGYGQSRRSLYLIKPSETNIANKIILFLWSFIFFSLGLLVLVFWLYRWQDFYPDFREIFFNINRENFSGLFTFLPASLFFFYWAFNYGRKFFKGYELVIDDNSGSFDDKWRFGDWWRTVVVTKCVKPKKPNFSNRFHLFICSLMLFVVGFLTLVFWFYWQKDIVVSFGVFLKTPPETREWLMSFSPTDSFETFADANPEDKNKTDIYIKSLVTNEEIFLMTLRDVFISDFFYCPCRFGDYRNGYFYIKRRSDLNVAEDDLGEKLWRYDLNGNGKKIFSPTGNEWFDFLISPDGAKIAVWSRSVVSSEKVFFVDTDGGQLRQYSSKELDANLSDEARYLDTLEWTSDGRVLWGSFNFGPSPLSYYEIDTLTWQVEKYNVSGLAGFRYESDLNADTKKVVHSDYPVFYETDSAEEFEASGKKVTLYLYDFVTQENKEIAFSIAKAFNPKWIDNQRIEYDNPDGESRLIYSLTFPVKVLGSSLEDTNLAVVPGFPAECQPEFFDPEISKFYKVKQNGMPSESYEIEGFEGGHMMINGWYEEGESEVVLPPPFEVTVYKFGCASSLSYVLDLSKNGSRQALYAHVLHYSFSEDGKWLFLVNNVNNRGIWTLHKRIINLETEETREIPNLKCVSSWDGFWQEDRLITYTKNEEKPDYQTDICVWDKSTSLVSRMGANLSWFAASADFLAEKIGLLPTNPSIFYAYTSKDNNTCSLFLTDISGKEIVKSIDILNKNDYPERDYPEYNDCASPEVEFDFSGLFFNHGTLKYRIEKDKKPTGQIIWDNWQTVSLE